jgi:hypothetical protein
MVAWFEGPDFLRSVDTPDEVISEEAWLTCSPCLDLVRADDRDALVGRAKRRHGASTDADTTDRMIRESHERFWGPRSR